MFRRSLINRREFLGRTFSSITSTAGKPAESAVSVAKPVVAKAAAPSSGSSFFERFSSFLVGAGIGFGGTFYFVVEELRESNHKFESYLDKLEHRVKAVEAKK